MSFPPSVPPPGDRGQDVKGWTPYGWATDWWRRVGATLIDSLTLLLPNFIVDSVGGRALGTVLSVVISAGYVTVLLARNGQTVGNMAVRTRVVDARAGGHLGVGQSFLRWACDGVFSIAVLAAAAANLSGLVFFLVLPVIVDALWPLWDRQNQTLHDKIASTYVLYLGQ